MRPAIRYAATALAAVALGLLAIRPERTVIIHPADALLVTPGAQPARVRRLALSHPFSSSGSSTFLTTFRQSNRPACWNAIP